MIFDCDGVLVDSEEASCRALATVLQGHGVACDELAVQRRFIGRSLASVIALLAKEDSFEAPADFAAETRAATLAALSEGVETIPGVVAALDTIERAGIATCVASSGRVEKIALTLGLSGLLSRFDGRIFSAEQVAHAKPAPDLFLLAATTLRHAPDHCIVIEDSLPGLEAAHAAGMRAVAYTAAPWSNRAAMEALAWRSIDDMAALTELLGL